MEGIHVCVAGAGNALLPVVRCRDAAAEGDDVVIGVNIWVTVGAVADDGGERVVVVAVTTVGGATEPALGIPVSQVALIRFCRLLVAARREHVLRQVQRGDDHTIRKRGCVQQ